MSKIKSYKFHNKKRESLIKKRNLPPFNTSMLSDSTYRYEYLKKHIVVAAEVINQSINCYSEDFKLIAIIGLFKALYSYQSNNRIPFSKYAFNYIQREFDCNINNISDFKLEIAGYINLTDEKPSFVVPVLNLNGDIIIQNDHDFSDYVGYDQDYKKLNNVISIDKTNFLKMIYGFIDNRGNVIFDSKKEIINKIERIQVDKTSFFYLNFLIFKGASNKEIDNCLIEIRDKLLTKGYTFADQWYNSNKRNFTTISSVHKSHFAVIENRIIKKKGLHFLIEDLLMSLNSYLPSAEEASRLLIEENLRLVAYIAKKYENNIITPEDLVSIGCIGLIKAANSFKSYKGFRFATYAARCIENEILISLRSHSVNIGSDKKQNDNINDILKENLVAVDILEINSRILSQLIKTRLTKKEKLVIKMRYGLNGFKSYSVKELSNKLGLSETNISKIENQAIRKLTEKLNRI